jgi:hypothetical protein
MSNELGILSNDLGIYFRGFEVALERKDVAGAVQYLKKMRSEVDENIEFLTRVYVDARETKPLHATSPQA